GVAERAGGAAGGGVGDDAAEGVVGVGLLVLVDGLPERVGGRGDGGGSGDRGREGAPRGVGVDGPRAVVELVAGGVAERLRAVLNAVAGVVVGVGRRGAAGGPGREPVGEVVGVGVGGRAGEPGRCLGCLVTVQ